MDKSYAGKFETGQAAPATPHLAFLDGMRGFAAVYVVMHHAIQASTSQATISPWLEYLFGWGHAAVTVFISISGYCLALPVVRSGRVLKHGSLNFFRKRARRIFPPYYVALGLGILACVYEVGAGHRAAFFADPFNQKAIFTHLLLIQNWFYEVMFNLNGPLWSVAVEVQIYLAFPLIVWIWRRFGSGWMMAFCFVAGYLPFFLHNHAASTEYLAVFGMGAVAADLSLHHRGTTLLKWAFALSLIFTLLRPEEKYAIADPVVGIAAASMMALCARGPFWPRRILSLRPLVWVGGFSYSLYLVHSLIQYVYWNIDVGGKWSPILKSCAFMSLAITPVCIVLAFGFHLAIERPFMTAHKAKGIAAQEGRTPLPATPV